MYVPPKSPTSETAMKAPMAAADDPALLSPTASSTASKPSATAPITRAALGHGDGLSGRDVEERGVAIGEARDQPRAGNAIRVGILTRDPFHLWPSFFADSPQASKVCRDTDRCWSDFVSFLHVRTGGLPCQLGIERVAEHGAPLQSDLVVRADGAQARQSRSP